jgi:DNA-binding NarL/FixJ family response regulator
MGMKFEDKLNTVLVIDDEPFETEWLTDYFKARGFEVVQTEDLQGALAALEKIRYRYVIIDLSIPFSPALAQPLLSLGAEFFRYPGLMAARKARSTGHNTFQVIVYSVHDSDDVQAYADRIVCRYILKGRPRELKAHIETSINRQPHGWRSLMPKTKRSPRSLSGPKRPIPVRPTGPNFAAIKRKKKMRPAVVRVKKTRPSYRDRRTRQRIRPPV